MKAYRITDWDKNFIMTADVNLAGLTLTQVGTDGLRFTGVFDGNSHVIRNAVINLPSSYYVGLFGNLDGQIKNLGVENVSITGYRYVGGLAGFASNSITNCYSTGTVSGNSYVGGLIGEFDGGIATSCFWDMQTSGQNTSAGGTGLTTSAMHNSEIYLRAFWDLKGEIKNGMNDIWVMPQSGGYPVLAWQVDDSSVSNDEMSDAIAVTAGTPVSGTSIGAAGLDITQNGYKDFADVWYYFDCTEAGKYTVTVEREDFNSTVAVFDSAQTEIVFNDYFFGNKSAVILNAASGQRYYIRVAGSNGQTGDFTLTVNQGAIQVIQGDLNYDGAVNLVDLAIFAGHWLQGT